MEVNRKEEFSAKDRRQRSLTIVERLSQTSKKHEVFQTTLRCRTTQRSRRGRRPPTNCSGTVPSQTAERIVVNYVSWRAMAPTANQRQAVTIGRDENLRNGGWTQPRASHSGIGGGRSIPRKRKIPQSQQQARRTKPTAHEKNKANSRQIERAETQPKTGVMRQGEVRYETPLRVNRRDRP